MAALLLTITGVHGMRRELIAYIQSMLPGVLNHSHCTGGELLVTGRSGGKILVVTYWHPRGTRVSRTLAEAMCGRLKNLAPHAKIQSELMDDLDAWAATRP